jgi:hypothetical protein
MAASCVDHVGHQLSPEAFASTQRCDVVRPGARGSHPDSVCRTSLAFRTLFDFSGSRTPFGFRTLITPPKARRTCPPRPPTDSTGRSCWEPAPSAGRRRRARRTGPPTDRGHPVRDRGGRRRPPARQISPTRTAARAALADATIVFTTAQPAYHRWVEEFPALQVHRASGPRHRRPAHGGREPLRLRTPRRPTHRGHADATDHEEGVGASRCGVRSTRRRPATGCRWRSCGPVTSSGRHRGIGVRDALLRAAARRQACADGRRRGRAALGDVRPRPRRSAGARGRGRHAWGRAWHAPCAPAVTQRELAEMAASAIGREARSGAFRSPCSGRSGCS